MVNRIAHLRKLVQPIVLSFVLCWLAVAAQAFTASLTGVTDEKLKEKLEGASLSIETSELEETPSVQEIISTAQADYRRLLAVLYDNGYFGPTIVINVDGREVSTLDPVTPPSSVNRIDIIVSAGNKFRFGRVEVTPSSPATELPEGFQLGKTASLSALKAAANAGVSGWREDGHAKAKVTGQRVTANHQRGEVDASIFVEPGPKLTFGPLLVDGTSSVRPERIVEIAGLPEGTVFSPGELEDSADRLRRTGAFRSVAMIESDTIEPDNVMPIEARVTDQKPRRIGFGGEVATTEGLTLRGYWIHRNLMGGAERLRFDAEISGIGGDTGGTNYTLGVNYERPATFNADTNFFALGKAESLDEELYETDQVTLGVGIEYFETDERSYTFGIGLRRADDENALGSSKYTLLLFPATATFDYRDNELDARKGYYMQAKATPFLALSGSDNGLSTELDYRYYLTLGESSPTTLAFRGLFGSLVGPSLEDAPVDFLFYSGGGGTVRGHDFESLGVDVGEDDDVGGRSFVGLSAEARFRTSGSLGYVAFFDAGYVGPESYPDGSGEWQSGAGLGLRYATGIGPIRFDVAVPTSGDDDASSFYIYIGIGQAF